MQNLRSRVYKCSTISVSLVCTGESMTVTLNTEEPFKGKLFNNNDMVYVVLKWRNQNYAFLHIRKKRKNKKRHRKEKVIGMKRTIIIYLYYFYSLQLQYFNQMNISLRIRRFFFLLQARYQISFCFKNLFFELIML